MYDLQSQYRFLFDNMIHGAFFQDADGRLVDVNGAALELFGLSRDQFLGRTSYHPEWHVIDENGAPLLPEQHPSMVSLQSGESIRDFVAGVYHPLRQDFVWLQINSTPMFREGERKPYRVFVTLHDITGQKRTTERLAASEERYRAIVNSQFEFVDRYLPGGILTFVNDALCHYTGLPREELIGRSFYPFLHEDDRDSTIRAIESLDSSTRSICLVSRVILPDGSLNWHQWTHHAIFDQSGRIVEYQSVGRDITAQKRMELDLTASEERYRAIVNTQLDFVDRFLPGGILTFVNDALCHYTGMPREQLLGRSFYDFIHEADRRKQISLIEALTSTIRSCGQMFMPFSRTEAVAGSSGPTMPFSTRTAPW